MSDADSAGGSSSTDEAETQDSDDEFEPVQVFPDTGDADLRAGADDCTKVGACDASCPVAEVDDDFPGPQFQGPEQWRLTRRSDERGDGRAGGGGPGDGRQDVAADADAIDDSVMQCSNCMRCDDACPSGVPLSQMHNTARGRYVDEQGLSWTKLRNLLLANYRLAASVASRVPRLSTSIANNGPVRWLGEKVFGISREREFPAFAPETFREWWAARGGRTASLENAIDARKRRGESVDAEKRVAYFHGCYANFNTPEVAKALVRVYEHLGYEIVVPEQGCSGTPMFANGFLEDARRDAEKTLDGVGSAVEQGYDVVASCTSCSMALRQEYPEQFAMEGIDDLAAHTHDAIEYLRIHEDLAGMLAEASVDGTIGDGADGDGDVDGDEHREFAYHAPCHARNQGLARQAVELFDDLDGVAVTDVGDSCSGISGTYGWKAEKYETSMEIGAEMFEHMDDVAGDRGLTECPTCAMQMEHGTGDEITHPLEVIEAALVDDGEDDGDVSS